MSGYRALQQSTSEQRSNSEERRRFKRSGAPSPQPEHPDPKDVAKKEYLSPYSYKGGYGAPGGEPDYDSDYCKANRTRTPSPGYRAPSRVPSVGSDKTEVWEGKPPLSDCEYSHESLRGPSQFKSVHGSQPPEPSTAPRTPRSGFPDYKGPTVQAPHHWSEDVDYSRREPDPPARDPRERQ